MELNFLHVLSCLYSDIGKKSVIDELCIAVISFLLIQIPDPNLDRIKQT